MKLVIRHNAVVAALFMSTSVFAGPVTARPVTEFDLIRAGLGPVDIITPASTAARADRHVQPLTVVIQDEQGGTLAGVTCTLANDQGSWSMRAGETVMIHRSTSDLRAICMRDAQLIASAVIASAQTRVPVLTGPFGGEVMAAIPAYPVALVFAPASTAASTAASPLAPH